MITFIKFWSWLIGGWYLLLAGICVLQFPKQGKMEPTIHGIMQYNPIGFFFSHMFKVAICASILYFF